MNRYTPVPDYSLLWLRLTARLAALLLCCLIAVPLVNAESVRDIRPIRMGTMELAPYGWIDEDGVNRGLIYEMNQEIGERSGLPYTNTIMPFKRLVNLLEHGLLDLISSQPHKSVVEAGELLAIQHKVNVIAVSNKDSGIETFEDLRGKNIIYHDLASYKQLEGVPDEIFRVSSYEQMLKMLYHHDVYDAAVISEPAFYYLVKQVGLSTGDFGNTVPIELDINQWIVVRKDLSEPMKEMLRGIVTEIYKEKMYERLIEELK